MFRFKRADVIRTRQVSDPRKYSPVKVEITKIIFSCIKHYGKPIPAELINDLLTGTSNCCLPCVYLVCMF